MVAHNVHRLNDILMLQRAADTELRGDLLLILPLTLALPLRSELFHRIYRATVLARRLDQPDSAAGTATQYPPPLPVLL